MNQEVIAGMILCAMGLFMLLVSPVTWWKIAEKRKTKDGSGPERRYTAVLRVLGVVFLAFGIALAASGL